VRIRFENIRYIEVIKFLLVAYSHKTASYTDEGENTYYFLSDFHVFIRQETVTFYDGI